MDLATLGGRSIVICAASVLIASIACGTAGAETLSLSLSEAIRLSLTNDHAVKAAVRDSAAAEMSYRAARALRYPTLSLQSRSTYKDEIPSLEIGGLGIRKEIGSQEIHQTDITLSIPLFTSGRIPNTVRMEHEASLAESANLSARRLRTGHECRRAYLELLLAEAMVSANRASLRRLELIQNDITNLHLSGLADSIDILEAALAVEAGTQALDEQKSLERIALARLRRVIGLGAEAQLELTEQVNLPGDPVRGGEDRPPITRPELERLEHIAAAAEYAANLSRAEYLPNLAGFAGYLVGKPNQDIFNNEWNDYFMAGLSLTWDFNLGGSSLKSAAAAREKARSALQTREDLLNDLKLQYEAALVRANHAYESIMNSERRLELARRKFHLASQRQKAGMLATNRVLEIEADLATMEQHYLASIAGYYLAEADYLYAVGSPEIFGGLQ